MLRISPALAALVQGGIKKPLPQNGFRLRVPRGYPETTRTVNKNPEKKLCFYPILFTCISSNFGGLHLFFEDFFFCFRIIDVNVILPLYVKLTDTKHLLTY